MSIYLTSDTHFHHKGILKHRPFETVEEMNETLVKNWNAVVGPGDTVYHLGDVVVWGTTPEEYDILKRLNGKIHLILGNHDKLAHVEDRAVEDRAGPLMDQFGRHRYASIRDMRMIKHNHRKVILCHYPLAVWDCKHHGSVQLHGHNHGNYMPPDGNLQMDVGVDCQAYAPVNIEEIFLRLSI